MLHVFVDDNYSLDVEIRIFARNMKREVIGAIDSSTLATQNMIRKELTIC
jgi:hypothetical protein